MWKAWDAFVFSSPNRNFKYTSTSFAEFIFCYFFVEKLLELSQHGWKASVNIHLQVLTTDSHLDLDMNLDCPIVKHARSTQRSINSDHLPCPCWRKASSQREGAPKKFAEHLLHQLYCVPYMACGEMQTELFMGCFIFDTLP